MKEWTSSLSRAGIKSGVISCKLSHRTPSKKGCFLTSFAPRLPKRVLILFILLILLFIVMFLLLLFYLNEIKGW